MNKSEFGQLIEKGESETVEFKKSTAQLDKSLGFVLEHIHEEVYLAGKPDREERYEYPPDAIREAITHFLYCTIPFIMKYH